MNETARSNCEGYGRFCWMLERTLSAFASLRHGIGVACWERKDGSRPFAGVALHGRGTTRYRITFCPFCGGPVSEPEADKAAADKTDAAADGAQEVQL